MFYNVNLAQNTQTQYELHVVSLNVKTGGTVDNY